MCLCWASWRGNPRCAAARKQATGCSCRARWAARARGYIALMAGEASAVDLAPHFRPTPRLQVGTLARELGATAMMDLSDGLAADLPKLLRASGVGAVLDAAQVPAHPAAARWAQAQGIDPVAFAIAGGEDYELLLAASPPVAQRARWSASPPRQAFPSRKLAR
jgi:thiamine monophosphate kinase